MKYLFLVLTLLALGCFANLAEVKASDISVFETVEFAGPLGVENRLKGIKSTKIWVFESLSELNLNNLNKDVIENLIKGQIRQAGILVCESEDVNSIKNGDEMEKYMGKYFPFITLWVSVDVMRIKEIDSYAVFINVDGSISVWVTIDSKFYLTSADVWDFYSYDVYHEKDVENGMKIMIATIINAFVEDYRKSNPW